MRGMTKYQIEVLQKISAGGPDGHLDFDQLLPLLHWSPSKDSMQFTIRAMCAKGLVEKRPQELRRGRKRVVYAVTPEGALALDPRALAGPEAAPAPARVRSERKGRAEKVSKLPDPAMELPAADAGMELPEPAVTMDELQLLLEENQQSAMIVIPEEILE